MAFLATVAILAGACTGQQATEPPAAATPEPTPEPTPAISTDKLVVIQAAHVASLDVHVVSGSDKNKRIAEPLLKRDAKSQQPGPNLATSWRQIDPLTWEFKLRSGVTFHNGETFDSETVRFSFQRLLNPDLRSPLRATFSSLLDVVEPVDATTVRIKTKTPFAMFLERLLTVGMVPKGYITQVGDQAYGLNPVGTGPYKFVEWVQGQHVIMERYDDYWGPKPAFRQVVYREITEGATAISELLTENAHIIVGLQPDLVGAVKASEIADVVSKASVDVLELRMDALGRGGENPFTDKRVRQAATYAIDREAIITNLFGGYGRVVATNIVPEMLGHDPGVAPYPHDPARARQLLAEAGYPDGFDARLLWFPASGFTNVKAVTEAIQADLAKVGIRTELFSVASAQISQYTTTGQAGPIFIGANANGGFYDGGFGFFFLRERFRSSYYWSDELEALIVKIETSTDAAERKQLLSQVQKLLKEEAPYVWIAQGFDILAVNKHLDVSEALLGPDVAVEAVKPKK